MANMKAIRYYSFGGPEVLRFEDNVAVPGVGVGEVLVRVHAAGVNPADWKTIKNLFRQTKPEELPLIPGWDISGEVVETASDVTAFKPGDLVYGMLRFPQVGAAYAEYTAAPASQISHKPKELTHLEAAAVPLAGLTAWQMLHEKANVKAGQTVFVNGAAGGVGHLAVQIAKAAGAWVIGTASAAKFDFLRELGVDEPIDYHKGRFDELAKDVDIFFDSIGNSFDQGVQILKPGGVLVSVVPFFQPNDQAITKNIKVLGHLVYPSGSQLVELTRLIEERKLRPFVQATLPLEQAQQALEMSKSERTKGKLVLQIV